MENNIIFRNFVNSDSTQIAEIEKLCFSEPWSQTAIEEFVSYSTSHVLVACIEEVVVGYITFMSVLDEIQIANVAIHPNFRRRHIAESLLCQLDKFASETKTAFITLEVRASNMPAIELYKKSKYEIVGERKNYYSNPKENAILMNKVL